MKPTEYYLLVKLNKKIVSNKKNQNINCKICSSPVKHIFNSKVLNKYDVGYSQCTNCGFIQTDEPYWLDEAYNNAITSLDLGLISRNLEYSDKISSLILNNFDINGKFLDYAGGYGMFTRLMRDKGFDYYHQDQFCVNLYAQNFELDDLPKKTKFEFVTAFEVFEHFSNPLEEIKNIFKYSNTIIFSTELQPDLKFINSDQWWYFTPETGQHIAFYSRKALEFLAKFFNCYLYSEGSLHILSKAKLKKEKLFSTNANHSNLKSLLEEDFQLVRKINKTFNLNKLNQKNSKSYEETAAVFEVKLLDALNKLENKNKILVSKNQEIVSKNKEIVGKNQEIVNLLKVKNNLELHLLQTQNETSQLNNNLKMMQNTKLWRLAERIRGFAKILLPKDSSQRNIIKKIYHLCLYFFQYLPALFKVRLKNFIKYFNSDTDRKSKKIVYIGHSYHDKTQSTAFLINYLKEHFEVTVILDETWQGKAPPNLNFIDDSYLGVIFFQNIYSPEIINKIKNKNIIFCPMYDGSGALPNDYWLQYKNIKFLNFSKTLHKKLINLGLNSFYLQYFPRPSKFCAGNMRKIFFWQRLTHININTVEQLFTNENKLKIHLHKAIDPQHSFIEPTKGQEQKFSISYSTWFKNKEELLNLIKKSAIYVAPRENEGIGLSFLEAMAMGKAVVAVNNPTMNEYIRHNQNGYLFDLDNPKKLNLLNLETIQRNAFKCIKNGHRKWLKNKIKIINFIKK